MKNFHFNEKCSLENMIKSKFVDENNITNTIYKLAKYNYHILGLNDDKNYDTVLKYILKNCNNIFEESIYNDITNCIKSVKKHKLASIQEVCITKSELDVIDELHDIKQQKAIFVILAVSKYFNALHNEVYDAAFLTSTDICKMARITIPVKDRDVFMQFLYDKELLYRHTWAGSTIKQVTFVSHDPDDEIVLRLKESDFKDLAYTYMAYIEPKKFRRCVKCGRWIRVDRHGTRLCIDCKSNTTDSSDLGFKTITCQDCGKQIVVKTSNKRTCRCDDCQEKSNKERYLKYNQKR